MNLTPLAKRTVASMVSRNNETILLNPVRSSLVRDYKLPTKIWTKSSTIPTLTLLVMKQYVIFICK